MKWKRRQKRKQARVADYHKMIKNGSRETTVQSRMNTGGYRCPGSNKK